jgi:tetratricopeptide (TPR) repeat protein
MKKYIKSILTLLFLFTITSNLSAIGSSSKSPEEKAADDAKKAVNEYNDGVKHMDKANQILIVGDSAFAYNYRATSDAKAQREYKKAVKKFKKAIDIKPDMKEAYNNLGYCYRKLGELDKSIKAYTNALRLDPNFAQAREYLGETYLALNRLDKANEQLSHLTELKSPYADTLLQSIKMYELIEFSEKINTDDK